MAKAHALLSASSSERWLRCPPSAKLNAAATETPSEYAAQGTDAHTLCERKVKVALGMESKDPTEDLTYYDEEMEQCADEYATYISELYSEVKDICPDPIVLIEQQLDFSHWVPEGFGTGDCLIVADGTLYVIDMKFGKGIEVSALENPQMMCYALGALELFDGIYDINSVCMTIFQPRRENISTYTIGKDELLAWAENTLKPTAELAARGEGDFKAGEHCQFCRVKATCRKRAEYNLELARYDFEMPAMLEDNEISAILAKTDQLVSWVTDIKEYALGQALNGTEYPDWKLVEGRSNRKYTDENAVANAVTSAGFDPYEHKVLGVTAMTKLLGKAKFEELLGGLIEKPQGKPTLVPKSDKRPDWGQLLPIKNNAARAAEDFKEDN